MWGFRTAQWTIEDDTYLAEIAKNSRTLAEQVMMDELHKQNVIRIFLFDVMMAGAWSWELHEPEGGRCDCPFCVQMVDSPIIKVQAVSRAAQRALNEIVSFDNIDVFEYVQGVEVETFTHQILHSQALLEELDKARDDYRRRNMHRFEAVTFEKDEP